MLDRCFWIAATALAGLAWHGGCSAEEQGGIKLKPSGFLEAGIQRYQLTDGYGSWRGQFVRAVLDTGNGHVWNAEIAHQQEFGDQGTLFVLGDTYTINPDWFASATASTSSGGFFLPRLRLDLGLNRKWLEDKSLVTTFGLTAVNAKDEHFDRSILLGASYYLPEHWVMEGGVRINRSNPGGVFSSYPYFAVTYGEEKKHIVSLNYSFGREAYQLTGDYTSITDFRSDSWTLTWRQWVAKDYGFQVRAVTYRNPYYSRAGGELAVFADL